MSRRFKVDLVLKGEEGMGDRGHQDDDQWFNTKEELNAFIDFVRLVRLMMARLSFGLQSLHPPRFQSFKEKQ